MDYKLYYLTCSRLPTEKAHGLQIVKMCEAFANSGLDVELWTTKRNNAEIDKDLFTYYDISPKAFLFKEIKTGLPGYYDFMLNKLVFWLRKIVFLLITAFKKPSKENSIIYTREVEVACLYSLLGYRVAYENHGWPESKIWLYKIMLSQIDKSIVLTKKLKERYKQEDIDCDVLVSADGVDIEKLNINLNQKKARKELDLKEQPNIITYVGKFTTKDMGKGLNMVVESLVDLENTHCLLVGGKRGEIEYFDKKAEKLSVDNRLTLFPHQHRQKIPLFLKSSDILLIPYPWTEHYAYNMSPLKLFEYMASKRPILSSDLPAIREVLNESNAFFFEPGKEDDFSRTVEYILNNDKKAKNKASNSFDEAQKYSWENRAKNILSFIKG